MTDQQHPIIPPPDLVTSWIDSDGGGPGAIRRIVTRAVQWGADQELEACCKWLDSEPGPGHVDLLRSCAVALLTIRRPRRPKPPSLAEEAYIAFVQICKGNSDDAGTYDADEALVRRALKRLQELEDQQ